MKINTKKSSQRKYKTLIIVIAMLLLGVISYGTYAYVTKSLWPFQETQDTSIDADRGVNDVDYGPPTEQDTANSQNAKERILEEGEGSGNDSNQSTSPSPDQPKQPVAITVSYAGIQNSQLEIRAFSSSVIEGSGTCTATITKSGSRTITRSTPAFIDASSTICEPIFVPRSELSAGTWNVNVTYSSSTHSGSSGAYEVEVS